MENPKSERLELKKISRSFLAWLFPFNVGFTGYPLPLQNNEFERAVDHATNKTPSLWGRLQDEISKDLLK